MTVPLPHRKPDHGNTSEPYGVPSPGLVARAESEFEKFLERVAEDAPACMEERLESER
ncbi:hypothetical protein [Streptomyces sp. NPDC002889]|uniref:hypothetical protein n=1 Tax=Streptomyces sp. NPDC002889 TaxID=3364669 RepID=UPI003673FCB4